MAGRIIGRLVTAYDQYPRSGLETGGISIDNQGELPVARRDFGESCRLSKVEYTVLAHTWFVIR